MDTDYPGDPLTPGVGATAEAKRLDIKDAKTITKIPVLPISYADAQPLLAALKGPVAPQEWRGGLPITYHVGPGPATSGGRARQARVLQGKDQRGDRASPGLTRRVSAHCRSHAQRTSGQSDLGLAC